MARTEMQKTRTINAFRKVLEEYKNDTTGLDSRLESRLKTLAYCMGRFPDLGVELLPELEKLHFSLKREKKVRKTIVQLRAYEMKTDSSATFPLSP